MLIDNDGGGGGDDVTVDDYDSRNNYHCISTIFRCLNIYTMSFFT